MLKQQLCDLVSKKVENTKARLAYKASTPVSDLNREGVIVSYWREGSILKDQIRHLGLAYAFSRGRRYWVVERHCEFKPSASWIADLAGATTEDIQAWLDDQPSTEELEAWEAHVAASKEKYRAVKAARRAARAA